jgi:hypothetical protein
MEEFQKRKCPYCGMELVTHPYWRHIEQNHRTEYENDRNSWTQLYKDYTLMGMDQSTCIQVISELFNQSKELIVDYLKENKVL